ncbi:hypothetical protein V5O48_014974 [Marasmius crinis-equi]|uniref:F-box domain-containing protein n=1 Tax=Marasmius crinis-equi TaxID=585013 RepID=A0ABR3EVU5_9AGAR
MLSIEQQYDPTGEIKHLNEENRLLRDEITRLQAENRRLKEVEEEKKRVDELDKEIGKLNELASLDQFFIVERSKSRNEIRVHGDCLSPKFMLRRLELHPKRYRLGTSKLPPEILVEIFRICCSLGSNLVRQLYGTENHFNAPPLRLSHVCQLWRNLVLSTSSLWSTFTIDPGYFRIIQLPLLSLYLQRSRGSLLRIKIEDSGMDGCARWSTAYQRKDMMLWDLFSHSERILSLVLEVDEEEFLGGYFSEEKPSPNFSHLTSLALQWTIPKETISELEELRAGCLRMFSNAPKLVSLTSPYTPHLAHPELQRHPIPLSDTQITSLTLQHSFEFLDMLQVIDSYPSLQEFVIPRFALTYAGRVEALSIIKRFRHDTLSTIIIHFPDHIKDEHGSYFDLSLYYFLTIVTLPALRSLTVVCPRNIGELERPVRAWHSEAYKDMVARSQCCIERLELVNIYVCPSDIRQTLFASPHLTHFTLFDVEDDDHFATESAESVLECLADLTFEKPPAPRLQELGISIELPSLSGKELARQEARVAKKVVKMAESRRHHHLPALKLTFRISQPLLYSTRKILEGMDKEAVERIFCVY